MSTQYDIDDPVERAKETIKNMRDKIYVKTDADELRNLKIISEFATGAIHTHETEKLLEKGFVIRSFHDYGDKAGFFLAPIDFEEKTVEKTIKTFSMDVEQ